MTSEHAAATAERYVGNSTSDRGNSKRANGDSFLRREAANAAQSYSALACFS